jgi:lipopolysaccharide export LptBFGC system permease protein LptF
MEVGCFVPRIPNDRERRTKVMLITLAVILLVLWLLGLVSSYTLSGFIHILLVVALVLFILSFVSGRRPPV